MSAIASQITSLTIVYLTVYSDSDQRQHQSSASLAFVRGIHRGPVNSPHKWPVTRKMFPFDDVITLLVVPKFVYGIDIYIWMIKKESCCFHNFSIFHKNLHKSKEYSEMHHENKYTLKIDKFVWFKTATISFLWSHFSHRCNHWQMTFILSAATNRRDHDFVWLFFHGNMYLVQSLATTPKTLFSFRDVL